MHIQHLGLHGGAGAGLTAVLAVSALASCSFDSSGFSSPPTRDAAVPPDRAESMAIDVAHVSAEDAYAGAGLLRLRGGAVIDTSDPEPTIDGQTFPNDDHPGIVLDVHVHGPPGGPSLAVLHVGDLEIPQEARDTPVRVQGSRPLVVIAGGTITLDGIIDASARGTDEPGPGGAAGGMGTGRGGDGSRVGEYHDSGGGGGGYGCAGGAGGAGDEDEIESCDEDEDGDCSPGGAGGMSYGSEELEVLTGGAGGGTGGAGPSGLPLCMPGAGGAGGGAVQLSAGVAIEIRAGGGVQVGGGGGGGAQAEECEHRGGGGGGGSGGAIFLQAPSVIVAGTLAANGGGGGGVGDDQDGMPGQDGALGDTSAAGGQGEGSNSGSGGAGGAGGSCAGEAGERETNGGGGGGGAGRIVLVSAEDGGVTTEGMSVVSPMPVIRSGSSASAR